MADLEFFWDPVCPWAWITSRWVVNVQAEQPMDVDWRFISLRMVNAAKDYAKDFPEGYERGHTRGLELLRVAAAARDDLGRDAVLPLYTAFGRTIHNERNPTAFDDPSGVARILDELGYPASLGAAATSTEHDTLIRSDTDEALERCGGNIGTPVLSFSPPEGPSFFGPVINVAPKGRDAVDLWDAVVALGSNPHFSELKRSTRGRPQFDD
jgi:2-hydroxychromene-2-carboxylate isomerase